MRVSSFKAIALACSCFWQAAAVHAADVPAAYAFKAVPYAPGSQGMQNPVRLNNQGAAVGASGCCASYAAAFWTENVGQIIEVSGYGVRQNYYLDGINNVGQVVGSYFYSGSSTPPPAVSWRPEKLPAGWQLIVVPFVASGINDHGQILGTNGALYNQSSELLATFSTLGGGQNAAMSLNNAGVAVGASSLPGDTVRHAALWQGTTVTDLGTLGGLNSLASDINDDGVVVGQSQTAGNAATRAVRWTGGVATDLGALPGYSSSSANAVNKAGLVVGYSTNTGGVKRATLWHGNTAIDLNSYLDATQAQSIVLTEAVDINDAGQILVRHGNITSPGSVVESLGVGYLMTPSMAPVVSCSASYKVTSTSNLLGFAVRVTVSNLGDAALAGWNVDWTYSANPFIILSNNVKLKVNGASVKATPGASNQTIAAKGQTSFTFTSLKGKTIPTVSGMTATLGGKSCTTVVE